MTCKERTGEMRRSNSEIKWYTLKILRLVTHTQKNSCVRFKIDIGLKRNKIESADKWD